MTHVRQIGNTQSTITVKTVEDGETIVLTIIAECSGCYAVQYEDRGREIAGIFVDHENMQELAPESDGSNFIGDEAEWLVIPHGDGTKWSEVSDDDDSDSVEIAPGVYEANDGTVFYAGE